MTQSRSPYLVTLFMILATAAWLWWIGRVPICQCGYVRLWYGATMTSQNSQHLLDWYSFSHLIHGFLFYGALWLVARRLPFGWRLSIATLVEAAWEIVENSNAIIERYRTVTIAVMVVGFVLARILPVWATVVLILAFEALTIWLIRDGLALNILMLLYPLDAVRDWQAAG